MQSGYAWSNSLSLDSKYAYERKSKVRRYILDKVPSWLRRSVAFLFRLQLGHQIAHRARLGTRFA
jgi:hypothetical protein